MTFNRQMWEQRFNALEAVLQEGVDGT